MNSCDACHIRAASFGTFSINFPSYKYIFSVQRINGLSLFTASQRCDDLNLPIFIRVDQGKTSVMLMLRVGNNEKAPVNSSDLISDAE